MVKVKEVMKKRVITITPDKTVGDAARIMTNNRVGSLVVIKGRDEPKDIVTESDVTTIVAKGIDPNKLKISGLKSKKLRKRASLITVKPDDDVLKVARLMVKSGIKRVPVVENGKLQGMIADKEILIISPELIEILSENLKSKVSAVARPTQTISGMCEDCGAYSDELKQMGNQWVCSECRA
jgi:predicted transcriptional regulator